MSHETEYWRPEMAARELCRAFRRAHRRRPTVAEIAPYLSGVELAALLGMRRAGSLVVRGPSSVVSGNGPRTMDHGQPRPAPCSPLPAVSSFTDEGPGDAE